MAEKIGGGKKKQKKIHKLIVCVFRPDNGPRRRHRTGALISGMSHSFHVTACVFTAIGLMIG